MSHHHRPRRRTWLLAAGATLALAGLTGCGSGSSGPQLALTAAIPAKVPAHTVLRIGDPATQVALHDSGLDKNLPFTIKWANISGGPQTLQAFRGHALDVGAVADIPPLFATWTGTKVKIVASRETIDPLAHPTYRLGVAPGVKVKTLADLKGKKIAYSPGQAQGALVLKVLKEAGLTQKDVHLVEMASVNDVYVNALGSHQVDVAPIGQALVAGYLQKYRKDGATTIAPGVRDDAWHLYAPVEVLQDRDKAAALKQYVALWRKAIVWTNTHQAQFAKDYYVKVQGLTEQDALTVARAAGTAVDSPSWPAQIAREQATADLLAAAQDHPHLDVKSLYDFRFATPAQKGGAS